MIFPTVKVKQAVDDYAVASGLAAYKRSRMPRCFDILHAAPGFDGRFLTGLDEGSSLLNRIEDSKKREAKRQEIKELRESLESATGEDLTGKSSFWETFAVEMSTDKDLTLNRENPLDVVKYHMLIASQYVAPNFDDLGEPMFRNCKYYMFTEEVDTKVKAVDRKKFDKAKAALYNMSEDLDRMTTIGEFLEGQKYDKKGMNIEMSYNMLSDYIEDKKNPDNIERFIKAVAKKPDEIQIKIVVDRALRGRIITQLNGVYSYGTSNLGKTATDIVNNLKKPEFAADYLAIKDEVSK